ncbi:MAG: phosphatase PAP2 family protein, partial [Actinomycetia bacterium]|nr:phosphatase PAP2 family protein [Actinomycetes bacterium]
MVETEWLDRLEVIDIFGNTAISVALVILIGLSALRWRVMAISYPSAFVLSWLGSAAIREIVERPRPTKSGDLEPLPSGHLVQAVFIAGLVPLALSVLLSDRRIALLTRWVLGIGVVGASLHRIHRQDHWPLDVMAGISIGLMTVLGVHWIMDHRSWHQGCSSCSWSRHPGPIPWRRGIFTVSIRTARRLGRAGVLSALAAALGLLVATVFVGLPTDPEGYGFGSTVSGGVQVSLGALMVVSGLVALRWQAAGAVGIAFAATGIGLFASVQYRPLMTVVLSALLLIPAVLLWLSWQRQETVGRIASLAGITITLLGSTAIGSNRIYSYYFGPTHAESVADELESEEADWLWLGDVDPFSATIVAGGVDDGEDVELQYWVGSGVADASSIVTTADDYGLARFVLTGLSPTTHYRYAVIDVGDQPSEISG